VSNGPFDLMTKAGPTITATIALIPLYTHKGGGEGTALEGVGGGGQLGLELKTDLLLRLLRCFQLSDEIALHFDLLQNLLTRITHIPDSGPKKQERQTVDWQSSERRARVLIFSTRRFVMSFPAFSCFFCAAGQKNSLHAVVSVTVEVQNAPKRGLAPWLGTWVFYLKCGFLGFFFKITKNL